MASSRTVVAAVLLLFLQLTVDALIDLQDVSIDAGLDYSMGAKTKYGGASIADLDGDGYPDMLFGHHDSFFVEVYFNKGNGTFSRTTLLFDDIHGISPYRHTPTDRSLRVSVSRGGSNGLIPANIVMYSVSANKIITEVTQQANISETTKGRGRSALYLPLRLKLDRMYPDLLVLNAPNAEFTPFHQQGLEGFGGGGFLSRKLQGFEAEPNWYGTLTDFDGDGRMEVLSYQHLRAYNVTGYFTLNEVTNTILPPQLNPMRGVVAVIELDYDNDGLWDLYICRSRTGDLYWLPDNIRYDDILLRNVGGRYVDVTEIAGIPQDGLSRGATAADFDNDGHIDLLVVKFDGPSIILHNLGDGTFEKVDDLPSRLGNAPGDMAQAIDYDRDGAVDIVMSEGHTHDKSNGGFYRILRNNLSPSLDQNNYLLVRVGSSPPLTTSSMHAVVTVTTADLTMVRRVGPTGVAVSVSYIELLHFGLGQRTVQSVNVRWHDGATQKLDNVEVNTMITVGVVS